MRLTPLSLQVVGANYPNKRGGNRKFEIAVTPWGERVTLEAEPNNPADRNAIKVMSIRGIQIGYIIADRTRIIRQAWNEEREVRAVFQNAFPGGCWIRVAFDGEEPEIGPEPEKWTIPDPSRVRDNPHSGADPESGFWPDEMPPEE